jgi:RecA-family ATPase
MTDAASAVAFLKTLFHGVEGDIFLCSLPNKPGGKPGEVSLRSRVPADIKSFIERWDQPGRGLYFCIGTIRPGAKPSKRGSYRTKQNIWRVPALPIDIDWCREPPYGNPQAIAIGMLERAAVPPQLTVLSGRGLHAYWLLEQPLEPERFAAAESMLRRLIQRFGSDPAVSDVSRLMRLPGTTNSKYGDERPAMIAKNHSDGRVSWAELEELTAEPAETPAPEAPAATGRSPGPKVATNVPPAQPPGNPFEAYGADAWKPPVDVEAALAAMHYPGNVHATQLATTASLLNAGMPLADTVALVFNATIKVAQSDWDLKREQENLFGMCITWLEKHPPETALSAQSAQTQNVVSFPVRLNGGSEPHKDTKDTKPPPRFASFSVAAFASQPLEERSFVVDQLVPTREVTLLYGDGGTGKSLLVLQLAVAMQTRENLNWLGLPVAGGRVLVYTAEEEPAELHRRLVAICEQHGVPLEELTDIIIISLAGEDATLAVPDQRQQLVAHPRFAMLETEIADLEPALVVIDTAADTYGGNENDRRQVGQFVRLLRGLALRHDTSIVLCAQPSLSGLNSGSGTSGSTAWNNSARSRLYLERVLTEDRREPDADLRLLRSMKANYAQRGFELQLRWQEGVFVPQLAPGGSSLDRSAGRAFADEIFLKMLAIYNRDRRNVSDKPGPTYAPAVFAADHRAEGVTKQRLAEAMNRLFQEKKIILEMVGPQSHQRGRLVIAP